MSRRQVFRVATGAIASVGLHACSRASTPTSNRMTIGTISWIGNAPVYIAMEKGFFKELGLEFNLQIFETVAAGFPAYLSGKLEGLSPVSSEAITLAARGADFRIVLIQDTSVGADVILARNSIKSIKDFKGKRIGAEIGAIGHFFVLQVLEQAGLSEKDVEIVNTSPDAAAAAFQTGELEIVYTFSPYSDQALKAQKDGRIIFSSKQMPTAIADLYLFPTSYIQSNPKAVAAFVEGHFKGLEFLKNNPKEGYAIAAKPLNITPEELEQQLKGLQIPDIATNIDMLGNPNSEVSMIKPLSYLATFLKAQGKVPAVPDVAKLLDPQFVKALRKA